MTAMIGDAGPPGRPVLGEPDPALPTRPAPRTGSRGAARGAGTGSGIAFDEFVAARSSALLRTAYLLTRDHGRAEDLLQTSLAKCWSAWSRIDGDPEPYVRRTLVTTYTSWWRRRWNGEMPQGDLPEQSLTAPAADQAVAHRHDLWTALGRLPRRQRATLVLRFVEDLTVQETAAVLGVSTGTVKSQTSKALAALRIDPSLAAAHDHHPETMT
ncbi:SigE family RNA polymerase sigma factor [Nocardioides sp.]|uniref:SigE family RNA polymerase sigma factor n=1 Tax=Nocardioides sp. TaxID=35761 RepID=UPI003511257C